MSHGKHRAPTPPKTRRPRRLRRIAAGLALSAAAATGTVLTTDLTATPADTAWGAPDTGADTAVTPLDTAWG